MELRDKAGKSVRVSQWLDVGEQRSLVSGLSFSFDFSDISKASLLEAGRIKRTLLVDATPMSLITHYAFSSSDLVIGDERPGLLAMLKHFLDNPGLLPTSIENVVLKDALAHSDLKNCKASVLSPFGPLELTFEWDLSMFLDSKSSFPTGVVEQISFEDWASVLMVLMSKTKLDSSPYIEVWMMLRGLELKSSHHLGAFRYEGLYSERS